MKKQEIKKELFTHLNSLLLKGTKQKSLESVSDDIINLFARKQKEELKAKKCVHPYNKIIQDELGLECTLCKKHLTD